MVIVEKRVNGAGPAELDRFVRRAQALARVAGEVDVLITGSSRVQALNRRFRRKNKPTDVLSFPREEGGGDIAISADIARQNARRYGHSTRDEVKVLVLHGMLHLAGYDHESDHGRMAAREARLRAQLRLPGSLIERAQAGAAGKGAALKPKQRRAALKPPSRKAAIKRASRKAAVPQPAPRRRRSTP
jgi:probable rRNA maturation factor